MLSSVSKRGTPFGGSNFVILTYIIVAAGALWSTWFAIPHNPEYFAMFNFMSTYGGFAIVVIYLLISIGALKGLRGHPKMWAVYVASAVGIVITAAAIYGGLYKVTAPTKWAPYSAIAIFVIGILVSFLIKFAPTGESDFSALSEVEQGPTKL